MKRKDLIEKLQHNPTSWSPTADVLEFLNASYTYKYTVLPLAVLPSTHILPKSLCVGIDKKYQNDGLHALLQDLRWHTNHWIEPIFAHSEEIESAISRCYRGEYRKQSGGEAVDTTYTIHSTQGSARKDVTHASTIDSLSSPIQLVNGVLEEAIRTGASDIHLEPFEEDMKIRLRHDGVLKLFRTVPLPIVPEVLSRVKVMAHMDIAEKRRPQDGRIQVVLSGGNNSHIDMRISSLPTKHGEKIVIRLLDKRSVSLDLAAIGMGKRDCTLFNKYIHNPYGMILVTGPTGSGKTTTLYSALNAITSSELNISTIEDPIEYQMEGVVQTAVKPEIELTFANALRTLLRQDPNVIMVGEIRDEETAQMAVRASMTGHLLLSTVHTNNASSTPGRLLDMGVEPFLIASSLSLIVAQRLVRKVCPKCLEPYTPEVNTTGLEQQMEQYQLLPSKESQTKPIIYKRGTGCVHCHQSGFVGRLGLFELLPISQAIQTLTRDRADAATIRNKAMEEGMWTLRQDGLSKVLQGLTTVEEVMRETDSDFFEART
jgi:type IV pilus assembly protein PilB